MKFPFLFKSTDTAAWPWPACVDNPKTLSFRANPNANNIFKTMNSSFLPDRNTTETPASFFSTREETFSGASEIPEQTAADDSAVVGGLRSDRLFFEPGETNSILEEAKSHVDLPCKRSVTITAMDSRDPCVDFRVSMEEVAEAHGLRDWESLEDLLTCYLRVNRKSNHGYIVGAFVDLLIHLSLVDDIVSSSSAIDEQCSSSSTATQCSFTSPLSFSSSTCSSISPCLSLLENEDQINVGEKLKTSSSS